jgi:hypothetical protein
MRAVLIALFLIAIVGCANPVAPPLTIYGDYALVSRDGKLPGTWGDFALDGATLTLAPDHSWTDILFLREAGGLGPPTQVVLEGHFTEFAPGKISLTHDNRPGRLSTAIIEGRDLRLWHHWEGIEYRYRRDRKND